MRTSKEIARHIKEFILDQQITDKPLEAQSDAFWKSLNETGTEIWLDTGDMEAAENIWSSEMSALTTNNTLLNKEIQKGIYDDLILKANHVVANLNPSQKVIEIAFILNAVHGLRLVQKFGAKVSVELHTDMAYDLQGILEYGERFHEIDPENFYIKVPLTSTGLIGARKLRQKGIPVNFTLGFSARQNFIITTVARPNFVNVFLGRINSFIKDNGLGTGDNAGEKATLASQRAIDTIIPPEGFPKTRQIAASMRSGDQVQKLAGVDVFTMPVKVAKEARDTLQTPFESMRDKVYDVVLNENIDEKEIALNRCWEITEAEKKLARELDTDNLHDGTDVIQISRDAGCGDIFPNMEEMDYREIYETGKIPNYKYWRKPFYNAEIAVDSSLTLSGLAAFDTDQRALDNRISRIIGESE